MMGPTTPTRTKIGSSPMSSPQSGVTKVALNASRSVQILLMVSTITGAC